MPASEVLSEKELDLEKPVREELLGPIPTGDLPLVTSDRSGFDFLYRRSTYYWANIVFSFFHTSLCAIGFTYAASRKEFNRLDTKNGYIGNLFVASGIYSLAGLLVGLWLTHAHYKKAGDARFSAGVHYHMSKAEALVNIMTLFFLYSLGPSFKVNAEPCPDNVRPVIYPILILLSVFGALSNIAAAYITYVSAKRVRGTEMVPNPNYRVPAWMLAGTEESQALSGNAIRI